MKAQILAATLLTAFVGTKTYGQTADENAALKLQLEAAQAKRDIATAQQDEAKAKLGTLDTSGLPKGSAEATSLNVEQKILAYGAVQSIASQIAVKVAAVKPTSVVIYSETELKGVLQVREFLQQVAVVHKAVARSVGFGANGLPSLPKLTSDSACGGAVAPAVAASGVEAEAGGGLAPLTAIGTVLQILSIAKTDKKMTGVDVEISSVALRNAVVGKLRERDVVVVDPATYAAMTTLSRTGLAVSKVFTESQNLANDSTSLDVFVGMSTARRQDLEQKVAARKADDACKGAMKNDVQFLTNKEALAKSLKASIDQQTAALVKSDDKTNVSPIQAMYASEILQARFAKDAKPPHVLVLTPIAAGGTTLTKTNFFTTNIFFSGGAVVSYALTDGDSGDIVLADTVPAYGGYTKAQDLATQR